MKKLNRVNMFEDSKASKFFAELSDMLADRQRNQFSVKVRNLFDKKSVSEEGQYNEFKITVADLKKIASNML